MHLYLSAGEPSGEQHASRLVRALRALDPGLRVSGMGGDILRDAGVETVADLSAHAVTGFAEALRTVPAARAAQKAIRAHLAADPPDAALLVDYGGFHLRLARDLRRRLPSLRLFYYIPPKAWAWNRRRVHVLRDCFERVFCILPFEEAFFRSHGVAAAYVGNPTMDAVRETEAAAPSRTALGLPEAGRLVALFAGSRRNEVRRIGPVLAAAAEALAERFPDAVFAAAVAPGWEAEDFRRAAGLPAGLPLVRGASRALLARSDFVLAKSGTTTLEAALFGVPMVVVYRTHPLTAWIARRVMRMPHFSLPNLVAGRALVPELFQEAATPARIAAEAAVRLSDAEGYAAVRRELGALRTVLGEEASAPRAARALLAAVGSAGGVP